MGCHSDNVCCRGRTDCRGISNRSVRSTDYQRPQLYRTTAGMAVLAMAATPTLLYLGCALFGLGSGNLTSLPGLLVQQEFPKRHFARIVSLVVAINQFSFAFGPTLVGQVEAAEGSYRLVPLLCVSVEALAAIIVAAPV